MPKSNDNRKEALREGLQPTKKGKSIIKRVAERKAQSRRAFLQRQNKRIRGETPYQQLHEENSLSSPAIARQTLQDKRYADGLDQERALYIFRCGCRATLKKHDEISIGQLSEFSGIPPSTLRKATELARFFSHDEQAFQDAVIALPGRKTFHALYKKIYPDQKVRITPVIKKLLERINQYKNQIRDSHPDMQQFTTDLKEVLDAVRKIVPITETVLDKLPLLYFDCVYCGGPASEEAHNERKIDIGTFSIVVPVCNACNAQDLQLPQPWGVAVLYATYAMNLEGQLRDMEILLSER